MSLVTTSRMKKNVVSNKLMNTERKQTQSKCLTEPGSVSIIFSGIKKTFRKKKFTVVECSLLVR